MRWISTKTPHVNKKQAAPFGKSTVC